MAYCSCRPLAVFSGARGQEKFKGSTDAFFEPKKYWWREKFPIVFLKRLCRIVFIFIDSTIEPLVINTMSDVVEQANVACLLGRQSRLTGSVQIEEVVPGIYPAGCLLHVWQSGGILDEVSRPYAQGFRQAPENEQRWVAHTSFDTAYVGSIEFGAISEVFLADAQCDAALVDQSPQYCPRIFSRRGAG